MRIHPSVVIGPIMLAGCVVSPVDLRALDARGRVEINQPYGEAASCILQQIDNKPNDLIARERDMITRQQNVISHIVEAHHDKGYVEIMNSPIVGRMQLGWLYVLSVRSNGMNSSFAEIRVLPRLSAKERTNDPDGGYSAVTSWGHQDSGMEDETVPKVAR